MVENKIVDEEPVLVGVDDNGYRSTANYDPKGRTLTILWSTESGEIGKVPEWPHPNPPWEANGFLPALWGKVSEEEAKELAVINPDSLAKDPPPVTVGDIIMATAIPWRGEGKLPLELTVLYASDNNQSIAVSSNGTDQFVLHWGSDRWHTTGKSDAKKAAAISAALTPAPPANVVLSKTVKGLKDHQRYVLQVDMGSESNASQFSGVISELIDSASEPPYSDITDSDSVDDDVLDFAHAWMDGNGGMGEIFIDVTSSGSAVSTNFTVWENSTRTLLQACLAAAEKAGWSTSIVKE